MSYAEKSAKLIETHADRELLRFLTCGSVDDGKSTLIGRLLHDSENVFQDHLNDIERATKKHGRDQFVEKDLSLLLDGLRAEREQGITIDVAYRYFATDKRKFIIADCPGHERYTRNMITGGSTANLALLLVDATKGIIDQTKRHATIVSLLNIQHVVIAINKMDRVEYNEHVFHSIRKEYLKFAARLSSKELRFIPVSALKGDNVVFRSDKMPWHKGGSILEYLENVYVASDRNLIDLRFPVQYAIRPDADFRGYCGSIASGVLHQGAELMVLPSREKAKIKNIHYFNETHQEAYAPMPITLTLEDELDISRGDVFVYPNNQASVGKTFEAMLVWMQESELDIHQRYQIKLATQKHRATISTIRYKLQIETLHRQEVKTLRLNDIARVSIEVTQPIVYDDYRQNKIMGSFILIDPVSQNTVAAGMIVDRKISTESRKSTPIEEERTNELSFVGASFSARYQAKGFWIIGLENESKEKLEGLLLKLEEKNIKAFAYNALHSNISLLEFQPMIDAGISIIISADDKPKSKDHGFHLIPVDEYDAIENYIERVLCKNS